MQDRDTAGQVIAVAGIGYVGLSNAVLLAQNNRVIAIDVVPEKVDMLNRGISPIADADIQEYLAGGRLDLHATLDAQEAYAQADYVLICTPTNYDEERNCFDTGAVDSAISQAIACNPSAVIVIKSTVPIGYSQSVAERYGYDRILFSPEFLREGRALHDNLYPSRIIVGAECGNRRAREAAEEFAQLLVEGAVKKDTPMLFPGLREAEAIKLFANTYLALRVSFFNELDTYAETEGLSSRQLIEGIGLDPRIGLGYNNPSFGYGGYCLPKDTKQLLANFKGIPQEIIGAIVESNATRKEFVARRIYDIARENAGERQPVAGVYRLTMKAGSDNFRQSSIHDIMAWLRANGVRVIVYENTVEGAEYNGYEIENNIDSFKERSDVIVANRYSDELGDCVHKLYTRDIYGRD